MTIPGADNRSYKFSETYPSQTIIPESSYFDLFRYEWLEGNAATALDQPFRLVLTESRAHLYFGDLPLNTIIGKEVIYDDSLHLTVSGIVKDWEQHSDLVFKEFISFGTIQSSFLKEDGDLQFATRPDRWGRPENLQTFVKLTKGTTPAQFESQTIGMIRDHMTHKEDYGKVRIALQPLSALHFDDHFRDFYSRQVHLPALYMLMGITVFILLIAAVNFINLSTAQSVRRAKEIGIRKVLGSSRSTLVLQFLMEAFLLTCLAAVLSLLILFPVMRHFREYIPAGLRPDLSFPLTWIFLLCTILLTSLLAGLYPAWVISSWLPVRSIQTRGGGGKKGYLRKGLIVFQFGISFLFIIGAIVMNRQTQYLLNKDPGFKKEAIISIPTSSYYASHKRNILAQNIRQLPGVSMVSACMSAPMIGDNQQEGWVLQVKDKPERKIECSQRIGDEYYVPLFGLKILSGRNFMPPKDDTMGFVWSRMVNAAIAPKHTEILINETCARQLGFKSPVEAIGQIVGTPVPGYPLVAGPIVGVVADFHAQSLYAPIRPVYMYGSKNLWEGGLQVKLSGQNQSADQYSTILMGIEKCWKNIYPDEPFNYQFLDKALAGFYDRELKTAKVTSTAMLIAIFISCMGLLGLVAFTAAQRTREIGIRKVLGAGVGNIAAMLSKEFLQLIFLSMAIASPIAWYFLHQWLQGFAYRVNITGWVFVLAGLSGIGIAMLTISFRVIHAALANPVKNLRTE